MKDPPKKLQLQMRVHPCMHGGGGVSTYIHVLKYLTASASRHKKNDPFT